MKLENIVLDCDVRNVFVAGYDKETIQANKPAMMYRYVNEKLPCKSRELYARDTNALYVLNKFLKKISMEKDEYTQIKIYIHPSLFDKITLGRYKYWVETGETQTGTKLADKELEQWVEFVNLYKEVFSKISWYKTKLLAGAKAYKYNKQEMMYGNGVYTQLHDRLLKKSEEDLNKKLLENM